VPGGVIVSRGRKASSGGNVPGERSDEVLHRSESARIIRRFRSGGSVVLKVALGSDAAARTRHEISILARLSGVPGVVKLAPERRSADTIALCDDAAVSLASVLQTERLRDGAFLELALELADTVAAIHALGIVHRDINPSNVVLAGRNRRPLLIDFHIATSFTGDRAAFVPQADIAGTLAYIAPEQTGRTGWVMDQRADLYALGATFYELATGHVPFQESDPLQLIRAHLSIVAPSPATLDTSVPEAFSDIVMRLLQKEPDRRYQSAEGLASDLRELIRRRARGENTRLVLGEHDFPEHLVAPSRPIGRETEIATLRAAFDDALVGGCNGLLIGGAAGVGKTTLIGELRSIVTARGGLFVAGKFDQYRADLDTNGVSQAMAQLASLLLAEPEAEISPLRARLLTTLGPSAALIAAATPGLGVLLEIDPDVRAFGDPASLHARLIEGGRLLLAGIAAPTRPVVFVLDDLQWAAEMPLAFVDGLLSANVPGLLVIGSYRVAEAAHPNPLAAMLSRWAHSSVPPRTMVLTDLPPSDLGDMLEKMLRLGADKAAQLARAVDARTHGNPYDTVELIDALRRAGALTCGPEGWTWDEATIRRFVGRGDVLHLVSARIEALPAPSSALLHVMAILGGAMDLALLQVASGLSRADVEQRLAPALDDGLVEFARRGAETIRFRHDRVQQAAFSRVDAAGRLELHLAVARRLASIVTFGSIAAGQYLLAAPLVREPEERMRVVLLFRDVANGSAAGADFAAAERFSRGALALLAAESVPSVRLRVELETILHGALCKLGRFEEADAIYSALERAAGAEISIDSACAQIGSLTSRSMPQRAIALGLSRLAGTGLVPPERSELAASAERGLTELYRWCDDEAARAADCHRPEATDARALEAAKLIERLMNPAFFNDDAILAWLVVESARLWCEHGPMAALVAHSRVSET
jgi:hypothetical protein